MSKATGRPKYRFNSETARAAGKLGGAKIASEKGSDYMRELGKKGGRIVSSRPGHMAAISRRAHGPTRSAEDCAVCTDLGF